MSKLRFHWVDVFAERKFEGNQLAVYPHADNLSTEQMQTIAREMNLSETSFITGTEKGPHGEPSYKARYFTVDEELPFAGHPTLGTSFILRELYGGNHVDLKLKVGNIPVEFEDRNGMAYGEMRQNDPVFGDLHDAGEISRIFNVEPGEIDSSYPIQTVSTGNPFAIIPFKKLSTMKKLSPDFSRMAKYLEGSDAHFMYAISLETADSHAIAHARMPFYGGEDPATGSAAGPAAAWLLKHGLAEPGKQHFIEQGIEIGRPSRIYVRGNLDHGIPGDIRVGGYCHEVMQGDLEI